MALPCPQVLLEDNAAHVDERTGAPRPFRVAALDPSIADGGSGGDDRVRAARADAHSWYAPGDVALATRADAVRWERTHHARPGDFVVVAKDAPRGGKVEPGTYGRLVGDATAAGGHAAIVCCGAPEDAPLRVAAIDGTNAHEGSDYDPKKIKRVDAAVARAWREESVAAAAAATAQSQGKKRAARR